MTKQPENLESMIATIALAPSTFIPIKLPKRNGQRVDISAADTSCKLSPASQLPNKSLVTCLARAFYWQKLLDEGLANSGSEIAKQENLDPSTVNELLRLTLLDPHIVEDIMSGTQPKRLTSLWFTRNPLPVEWRKQQILIEQMRTASENKFTSGDVHVQA
jgi:hypothetical protein